MPIYRYRCINGHECDYVHAMTVKVDVICDVCGQPMKCRPQALRVNWNGPKPSAGRLSPAVQQLIDTVPERRDRYLEKKEGRKI